MVLQFMWTAGLNCQLWALHEPQVNAKEGLPFPHDWSLDDSTDSYICFRLALLHSVWYLFFLCRSLFSSLCTVFDSVSSNIDKTLSINPSANAFVFRDFNVHHKDWLTFSGRTRTWCTLLQFFFIKWPYLDG